jgi:hypothetical protein
MCFGEVASAKAAKDIFLPEMPEDNSAEFARQKEAERQGRISAGTEQINKNFGTFDDNYYGGIRKAHSDFYMPLVDEQYKDARRGLTYKLANTGNLTSSAGATNLANLFRDYNRQRAQIGDQSLGAERDLRNNVEQNRSELLTQLNATADPEAAAASATARAKSLAMPPVFSPLGDLFQQYTGNLANSVALQNAGYKGMGFKLPNSSSSVRNVGY